VTSNKSFADWGEGFNDQVLATAILDRVSGDVASGVGTEGTAGIQWDDRRKFGEWTHDGGAELPLASSQGTLNLRPSI
jgi:hypothetical protein